MRELPPCPSKPSRSESSDLITETYDISVITPLFGGGVKAGKNDPLTLIRGSTVRGHLRFWWRATRGAQFKTVKELQQAEEKIWGSSETPSRVSVEIEIVKSGQEEACAAFPPDKNFPRFTQNYPAYALFPFQGKKSHGRIEENPAKARVGVEFKIKLTFPKPYQKELNNALRAWVNFGGVGARTRRGCGSLYCKALSPNLKQLKDLSTWYTEYFPNPQVRDWSTTGFLHSQTSPFNDAKACWNHVVNTLRSYRQGDNIGRNPGQAPNRPGRSRWPEAESLRHITNRRLPKHEKQDQIPIDYFPRAFFGLPIVFHFQGNELPFDATLTALNGERMSSPLILKPLAVQLNGQIKFIPILFQLLKTPLQGAKLQYPNKDRELNREALISSRLAAYPNSPLANTKGQGVGKEGSALVGFVEFFKKGQL